jgi:hypothetical protein
MAKITDLPPELHQWVCENLDLESLKALSIAYRSTSKCTQGTFNNNVHVKLCTGKAKGVHKVLAFLLSQAHSTRWPPNITITSTNDAFTDRIIKFASCIKTLTLSVPSTGEFPTPITDRQLYRQYELLVPHSEPVNMIEEHPWHLLFSRGWMEDMTCLLLRIVRHVTALELAHSLQWMKDISTQGMCQDLRTLKLVGINSEWWVSGECRHFAQLPLLETLEFASMEVTMGFVRCFGNNLSVSSLRFTNCYVTPHALAKAIRMRTALKEF